MSDASPPAPKEPLPLREEDMPELYRAADASSRGAQKLYMRATLARLVLLVVAGAGAVFDAIFSSAAGSTPGALIAAIAFMAAILLEVYLLQTGADSIWYEGRAAAESVKSLAWRYAVGGAPYGAGKIELDADQAFLADLHLTLQDLPDIPLAASIGDAEQISPAMKRLRAAPLDVRQAAYHDGRVEEQRRWYALKRRWNARRGSLFAILTLLLEVAGGGAAVLLATGVAHKDYYRVAAPLAVAFASWAQTKQYRNLASAYGIAALELTSIAALTHAQRSEGDWAEFVDHSEGAVSREHQLWRATRGRRTRQPHVPGAI